MTITALSIAGSNGGNEIVMRIVSFAIYYFKLRVGALLGLQKTHGPLNLRWRWETWHRLRRAERKYASGGTLYQLRSDLTRIWKMLVS